MNLYRTDYFYATDLDADEQVVSVWHGTLADAAKFRRDKKSSEPSSKPTTTTVNVPTNKTGLIDFLNKRS